MDKRKLNLKIYIMDFDTKKKDFIIKLNNVIEAYDELTKDVSPKHYRTTGHHFHELKKIKD